VRWGVCESALKPRGTWEGPWRIGQGSEPDLRNSAVQDYRGASGNVAYAGAPELYPNNPAPISAVKLKLLGYSAAALTDERAIPFSVLPLVTGVVVPPGEKQ
jgi:hypothetical protein